MEFMQLEHASGWFRYVPEVGLKREVKEDKGKGQATTDKSAAAANGQATAGKQATTGQSKE